MSARMIGLAVVSLAAAVSLTACNHGGSSNDTSDTKAKAKAIASSSANVTAENAVKAQVTKCVNATPPVKLLRKAGRQEVITCLKSLVPEDKQDKFKDCVAKAAVDDKVWTKTGRDRFVNASVAGCVTKVTASATPTPSSKPSGKKAKK